MRSLTEPWELGGLPIPNRVVLAPLAGIGNWFVRLQAKRYGAGLAVSRDGLELRDPLREPRARSTSCCVIDPREREGGPVAIQLFGQDPDVMRAAAARVAEARRRPDRPQHGLPRPEGAARPARAPRCSRTPTPPSRSRAPPREGSGLPVTVKLRAEGFDVARRLVEEAGVAGITFHPRTVKVRHKGRPDYDLAAELVQALPVPVIVSGGMREAEHVRWAFEYTGAEAIMLARGSLGNPWLFEQVLGTRDGEPAREEVLAEWALGRRPRRGAPRPRARRPLPAQVPPLVRRAPRRGAGRAGRACSAPRRSPSSAS